jgi:DNA mismatch endonuclease (patch repair protein)
MARRLRQRDLVTKAGSSASSLRVRARMQRTPQRDTPCELALRSALRRLGLRYRLHWRLPGTRSHADVAFVRARLAVFVDGCFWHGCALHGTWPKHNAEWWRRKIEANKARDRRTDSTLHELGWRVLRFWEHDDMPHAAEAIVSELRDRSEQHSRSG